MKSKLLWCLSLILLTTHLINAQTWNTLGTAQFADDPKYMATAVDESTGNLYVAYVDQTDSDRLKVKYFDGTTWIDLGLVDPGGNISLPSIRINPVTNKVWVAYKKQINAAIKPLLVKSYNSNTSSWDDETGGSNVASDIPKQKIILRFSPAGDAYIAYTFDFNVNVNEIKSFVVSNRTGSWANEIVSTIHTPYSMDFPDYRLLFYTTVSSFFSSTTIGRRTMHPTTFVWSGVTIIGTGVYPDDDYQGLAATTGTVLTAMHNFNSGNDIDISTWNTDLNSPANSGATDGKSIQLIRNPFDGLSYLLYVKTTGEVVMTSYDNTDWTDITGLNANIGSTSGDTALRAKLDVRESDGRVFVTYQDGTNITTKYFDPAPPPNKFYVDQNASGNDDGSSWQDAFTSLHDGLDSVNNSPTDTLFVAQGTYKPSVTNRSKSFEVLDDEVKVYGGFVGTETDINQRDIIAHPTIISGDLNANDDPNDFTYSSSFRTDNSYRLISVSADDVEINGFTLTGGHANGTSSANNRGAAIYKFEQYVNFTIIECIIKDNVAKSEGNLTFNCDNDDDITIESCQFINNLSRYGTGFYCNTKTGSTVNIKVNNSLFYNNTAADVGSNDGFSGSSFYIGANNGSTANAEITNNTFSSNFDFGNNSPNDKGTVVLRRLSTTDVVTAEIHNNIFWNNYSDFSGLPTDKNIGMLNGINITSLNYTHNNNNPGTFDLSTIVNSLTESDNLAVDPLFVDEANFDFSLQATSPMIDVGDDTKVPSEVTEDLAGNGRIVGSSVDLGAYEYVTLSNDNFDYDTATFSIYPNPTRDFINIESQNAKIDEVVIFDINGRKVKTSQADKINVSELSSGVYLMKIKAEQSNAIEVKRFIKQ